MVSASKQGMEDVVAAQSSITWIIRDMSEGGARLQVPALETIPDSFDVRTETDEQLVCDVAWKSEDEIGVKFRDSTDTQT